MLPIINNTDFALKQELLEYIDDVVRNEKNIEIALDYIDQRLLVDTLVQRSKINWTKNAE